MNYHILYNPLACNGQGEERLPQRGEEGVEADLAPVAAEHIGEADLRAVERDGAREQYNEDDEQRGHTDLVELLDAALNALDDDEGVDCHKDRGKENGGQREPCLTRRGVVAEQLSLIHISEPTRH